MLASGCFISASALSLVHGDYFRRCQLISALPLNHATKEPSNSHYSRHYPGAQSTICSRKTIINICRSATLNTDFWTCVSYPQ